MLKIINIVKEYKVDEESTLALNDVSIEFRKNEFVSILGPSGCGKTTLLNIIGGLDRYTSGDIQIDNISTKEYDDVDWDTYRNRRIGFVFQSYNLIPHLTILQNVSLGLTLAGVSREEANARALEALAKVGLETQGKKRPNQLSGGQAQRVAIARALVNNPEIILADEPTGALDSESGIQVMDLLKEVAADRLVIMVTHNPTLAEEYSTRIVYLKDGKVEGDTMPYSAEEELKQEIESAQIDESFEDTNEVADEIVEEQQDTQQDAIEQVEVEEQPRKSTFAERHAIFKKKQKDQQEKNRHKWLKRRHSDKSSMKLGTAISLSWNNLLSKKGRTLLTSIAGSIGIIGIILVLALSNGARAYVANLEESALSQYPISVTTSNLDISSVLTDVLLGGTAGNDEREEYPDTTDVYTSKFLGNLINKVLGGGTDEDGNTVQANDLKLLKSYIEQNFDKTLANVVYNYGINFNAYIKDPKLDGVHMKVNPYTETMTTVLDKVEILDDSMKAQISSLLPMAGSMMNAWAEMSDNQELLEMQYDVIDGKWPTAANELVVVVDSKNQLADYQLFMLGLVSEEDIFDALTPAEDGSIGDFAGNHTYTTADLLNLEYDILTNADYLEADGGSIEINGKVYDTYTAHNHAEKDSTWIQANKTVTAKVVGVVRAKEGAVGSISGVLGYTSALTNLLYSEAKSHPAIQSMTELYEASLAINTGEEEDDGAYTSVITYHDTTSTYTDLNNGGPISITAGASVDYTVVKNADTNHDVLMRALGVIVDEDRPVQIDFYCTSFDAKEAVEEFLKQYNSDNEGQNVSPSSSLNTLMGFVNTMADTLTGVLIGFAAISLVVSTIMIAIIIYTSVLERRKEIGVLRSIGARKKDVARVFLAESAILGGYSGIIGVIVSVILSFAGSALLLHFFNIDGLMSVEWWHCVLMLGISVVLSMFAGFIPSRIASKKDPAIALRSE